MNEQINSEILISEKNQDNMICKSTHIDTDSLLFIKFCLFNNVSPTKDEISIFFETSLLNFFNTINHYSLLKRVILIYSSSLKNQFLKYILNNLSECKNDWLLSNLNLIEVHRIDLKDINIYFKRLENGKIEKYLNEINLNNNWLSKEYNRLKLKLFVSHFKINYGNILFWFLILTFCIICLILAAKNNSFTIDKQINVWFHFIMGKN